MTPTVGSCRIRRSTTPTFVAWWSFSMDSALPSTISRSSLGRSFLIYLPPISSASSGWCATTIPTTTSIHHPTIAQRIAGLPPLRQQRKPSPTTCPIAQCHGAITRAILHALAQSTILSRRSRSLKCVARAVHLMPSVLWGPTNFGNHYDFCVASRALIASTSTPWSACGSMLWLGGWMMLLTLKSTIQPAIPPLMALLRPKHDGARTLWRSGNAPPK